MIDAHSSSRHYYDHIAPVWDALPEEHRGTFYVGGRLCSPCPPGTRPVTVGLHHRGPRVLVASDVDYRYVAGSRRTILMQHGSGQSYGADPDPGVSRHTSYAGGDGQARVDLFLAPGPHPAMRTRGRYPGTPCVEVGCPALDRRIGYERPLNRRAVIALAWHWDNKLCPETSCALPHFRDALPQLVRTYTTLGHSHPRAQDLVAPVYQSLGIPQVGYETVMELADVLVVDNSSVGFEFAATGRPVIWLTPPWYRPLNHGIRFGGDIGMEVRDPADLLPAVDLALSGQAPKPELSAVYSYLDGRSAERAAAAIVALETGLDPQAATLEVSA